MAVEIFDLASYQNLLTEVHPQLPRTETENQRLIQMVRELQEKERPTLEERELIAVLLTLIEKFEDQHYSTSKSKPHAILRELMRARDLKPKDLYDIFGSKGTTSEVLRGKRAISKTAAKSLAGIFNVKVDLFL